MKRYFHAVLKLSVILFLVIGYAGAAIGQSSLESVGRSYTYKIPKRTGDGWDTATLAEADLNPIPICEMVQSIRKAPL